MISRGDSLTMLNWSNFILMWSLDICWTHLLNDIKTYYLERAWEAVRYIWTDGNDALHSKASHSCETWVKWWRIKSNNKRCRRELGNFDGNNQTHFILALSLTLTGSVIRFLFHATIESIGWPFQMFLLIIVEILHFLGWICYWIENLQTSQTWMVRPR